jgi:hypothetical protein
MIVDGIRLVNGSTLSLGVVNADERGNALPASGIEGKSFELTAPYNGKQPGLYIWHNGEWVVRSPDQSAVPYDISGGSVSTLNSSAVILRHVAVRAFGIKAGFFGSVALSGQGPTNNVALDIRRVDRSGADTKIGEIQFAIGSTIGLFVQNGSTDMAFVQGETLYLRGPETADLTLSELSITLAGFLI